MKKVPYGISDYKKLKEKDYLYVDKTMYLEKLENVASTIFFLRPGRFGKSLFTSMMYYYYDVNSKDSFDTLFKGTYVYDNPTENKNNYYMLKFDFSGVSTGLRTSEELEKRFRENVISGINNFLEYYGINYVIDESRSIEGILKLFLSSLLNMTKNNKVYIY